MKLVILTSFRFGVASMCLPALVEAGNCSVTRVILSGAKPADRMRHLRRKVKKMMRIGLLGALNGIQMRSWYEAPATADIADTCRRLQVPLFEADHTNGDQAVRLMTEAGADLGLSLGNGYISERVFGIPRFGMINVHGELLPEYQNAQSVIWPVYNMETKTGLTIHQIDRSIDTGVVLYREEYPIIFYAHLKDTVRATIEITRQRTPAAVRYVCENYGRLRANAVPQVNGRSYTTPTYWQFRRMMRNNRKLHRAATA